MAKTSVAAKRLNLEAVRSESDFHDLVAREFAFSDYYGRNLDAFEECFEEFCSGDTVFVSGLSSLPTPLRDYVSKYLNVMKQLEASSPDLFNLVIE